MAPSQNLRPSTTRLTVLTELNSAFRLLLEEYLAEMRKKHSKAKLGATSAEMYRLFIHPIPHPSDSDPQ
jgi:hypothetical protein